MKKVAIIPARGGSKRIPRKNIKEFSGKPIIAYSIQTALASGLFDEVMVSTDDEEIAEVSQRYGASIPFLRSEKTSDDFSSTADVLIEVLQSYRELHKKFDFACCIYPTAPLINSKRLVEAFDLLFLKNLHSVFPVVRYSYPIWRSLRIEGEKAIMNWPEFLNYRSQDLASSFHDAGQFYWFNIASFLRHSIIFSNNTGVIELDELEVQDIDNITDWKLAELKYSILNDSSLQ